MESSISKLDFLAQSRLNNIKGKEKSISLSTGEQKVASPRQKAGSKTLNKHKFHFISI
jgi:hypothetical protein